MTKKQTILGVNQRSRLADNVYGNALGFRKYLDNITEFGYVLLTL